MAGENKPVRSYIERRRASQKQIEERMTGMERSIKGMLGEIKKRISTPPAEPTPESGDEGKPEIKVSREQADRDKKLDEKIRLMDMRENKLRRNAARTLIRSTIESNGFNGAHLSVLSDALWARHSDKIETEENDDGEYYFSVDGMSLQDAVSDYLASDEGKAIRSAVKSPPNGVGGGSGRSAQKSIKISKSDLSKVDPEELASGKYVLEE